MNKKQRIAIYVACLVGGFEVSVAVKPPPTSCELKQESKQDTAQEAFVRGASERKESESN